MSLINDALRRAKDAEQQTPLPPSASLPFRPVEASQQCARRGVGLLLPAALGAVALLTLLLVWQWGQRRSPTQPVEVSARTASVAPAVAAPQPAPVPATAAPTMPAPATQPNLAAQPPAAHSPVTGAAAAPTTNAAPAATNAPATDAQDSDVTNTVALTPPPPPKPAPLRLQAIVFNPSRPSAMIAGKTLFIGDKLGDLRVVAIDHESANLVGAGTTNVLSLPE
jgi:hypothetical protein